VNQSKFEVITCSWRKRGKMHASASRLVLVLLLIGWKSGANRLSQSRSVVIAKPITFRRSNENRSNNMQTLTFKPKLAIIAFLAAVNHNWLRWLMHHEKRIQPKWTEIYQSQDINVTSWTLWSKPPFPEIPLRWLVARWLNANRPCYHL